MSSAIDIASAFIQDAPPGELQDVVKDIESLTSDTDPSLISKLKPAFQTYNEEQLATAEVPGETRTVLISKYNRLPDGRYFDTETNTSFEFDHIRQKSNGWMREQKASSPRSYTHPSPQYSDLIPYLQKSLSAYATEHYASTAYGIYPTSTDEAGGQNGLAILLVSNKYSPSNFWNGRWRSTYVFSADSDSGSGSGSGSGTLTGSIKVTVHYYEDGNVSLTTHRPVHAVVDLPTSPTSPAATAEAVVKKIAAVEKAYQVEVNTAFVAMNEEGFKGLRRQLPVTRQKVEWEKVGGYRLGSDLRGGPRGR